MTDESKGPPEAAERGDAPARPPAGEGKEPTASPQTPPKAAAPSQPAPKPPAAKAPVKPDPWSSPLLDEIKQRFPEAVVEAVIFRNQPAITLTRQSLLAVCEFLKSDAGGGYTLLTDETAVDYPKREKRFEIIYHLYSFQRNDRLRLKLRVGEDESVPSVVGIWPAANWLEREVYDMFGVAYEGHPDLKRILLPEDWKGHPLRKDYDILRQDDDWVRSNLHIESGQ
jgi:NADH-quinone oxidoreductase subunit C